jgi:hypothetical protein
MRHRACCILAAWLSLASCGRPAYRLDGRVPEGVSAVSLVDTSASGMLDSVRSACDASLGALERDHRSAVDSLEGGMSEIGDRRAKAQAAYRSAEAAYRDAFSGLARFRSFGGNPIFSDADREVATSVLLQEIADRFYKGKAFSLETEAELRRFIRARLVPAERALNRARNASAAARRAQTGAARAQEELAAEHGRKRAAAVARHNEAIRQGLATRILRTAQVDSTGSFLFPKVPEGVYLLYSGDALPDGWLIPLTVSGHRRQELSDGNRRRLMLEGRPEAASHPDEGQARNQGHSRGG